MEDIDLKEVREGFRGKAFRDLIEYHLYKMGPEERSEAFRGTNELLPPAARPLVETFIDRWNARAYDREVWGSDTAAVFDEITADARDVLAEAEIPIDDDALFNMFNLVVMNFAYSAHDQPKMQRFIGIRSQAFPWLSALSLLYPIWAALHLLLNTPAPIATVLGYGITNLGYLLAAAAIFAGTFQVFGLQRRGHVFAAAAAALIVGIVLTNVGFQR